MKDAPKIEQPVKSATTTKYPPATRRSRVVAQREEAGQAAAPDPSKQPFLNERAVKPGGAAIEPKCRRQRPIPYSETLRRPVKPRGSLNHV